MKFIIQIPRRFSTQLCHGGARLLPSRGALKWMKVFEADGRTKLISAGEMDEGLLNHIIHILRALSWNSGILRYAQARQEPRPTCDSLVDWQLGQAIAKRAKKLPIIPFIKKFSTHLWPGGARLLPSRGALNWMKFIEGKVSIHLTSVGKKFREMFLNVVIFILRSLLWNGGILRYAQARQEPRPTCESLVHWQHRFTGLGFPTFFFELGAKHQICNQQFDLFTI